MKLNDEMMEMAINNKGICTIYNDDYVLLHKKMPVTDSQLDWYIESLRKLKDNGVNIASVVDYRLIDGTTSSYHDGKISYTAGVFLEERAKGVSNSREGIYLSLKKDYDFSTVIQAYLKNITSHIEELELRAQAPQSTYDKLIDDCQAIIKMGLCIDPKPLNFFFDKTIGYTIIDIVSLNTDYIDNYNKYFPAYMFSIVLGYGIPTMSLDYQDFSILPQDFKERLESAGRILEAKIVSSLRKYGFNEEDIKEAVGKNRFRYENKHPSVEVEDMEDYIATNFMSLKAQASQKKEDSSDVFTISC